MKYFLNEDKTYHPCSLEEWLNQPKSRKEKIGSDIINDKYISTIWMGIDHNFWGGDPLLFETMVFEGHGDRLGKDIYQKRYTTWDEAAKGHKKAIQWVLNGCKDIF